MSIQYFDVSHRYKIDGRWATAVSTALKGVPKGDALTRWSAKTVARHALDNISTLAADIEHHGYGPTLSMLSGVPYEKRDRAAVRGTEVHALAERYIAGEEIEVPAEVMPYVQGYAQYIEEWNPKSLHEEMIVASRQHWYAGRLDSIQEIPNLGVCLVDYKTSRGIHGEHVLQCAAYRFAEVALVSEAVIGEVEVPMIPVERALILHIQEGTYDLVPVQADEVAFEKFLVAKKNYLENVQSDKLRKLIGEPLVREVA